MRSFIASIMAVLALGLAGCQKSEVAMEENASPAVAAPVEPAQPAAAEPAAAAPVAEQPK